MGVVCVVDCVCEVVFGVVYVWFVVFCLVYCFGDCCGVVCECVVEVVEYGWCFVCLQCFDWVEIGMLCVWLYLVYCVDECVVY